MTTETRSELEENRSNWRFFCILLAAIALFLFIFFIFEIFQTSDLQIQLQECQEKISVRNSILFIKCEDGTLLNLLVDENNLTLYDYNIPKGCEVIE